MSKYDNVNPGDKWQFDSNVADCFENMLERSIPQYNVMRDSVVDLVKYTTGGVCSSVLDLGCSDGLMIEHMRRKMPNLVYTGVDVSEPMLEKAREHFNEIDNVHIKKCDIRESFPLGPYYCITSILSIQFTPIEYRQSIIQRIYDNLYDGGSFIMVEKVLGNSHTLNSMMVDTYYDMKRRNGYSQEQIDRKRLSLEGVLVPVTNDWNIDLLKQAGFKQIDVFWRWMNFVGYIAIK